MEKVGEGGIELNYDCIKKFLKTGMVEDIVADFHLDSDIVLQMIQTYTEHLKVPKEKWERYEPPKKKAQVATMECPQVEPD